MQERRLKNDDHGSQGHLPWLTSIRPHHDPAIRVWMGAKGGSKRHFSGFEPLHGCFQPFWSHDRRIDRGSPPDASRTDGDTRVYGSHKCQERRASPSLARPVSNVVPGKLLKDSIENFVNARVGVARQDDNHRGDYAGLGIDNRCPTFANSLVAIEARKGALFDPRKGR